MISEVFNVLSSAIKLDSHGLPLSPQPSDDPEDPRTYSQRAKYLEITHSHPMSFRSLVNWPLAYRVSTDYKIAFRPFWSAYNLLS